MAERVRFDRNARYGASMGGVLFAGYLNIVTSFDAFIQAENYAGVLGTDIPIVDVFEFLVCLGLYIVSFAMFPTSAARRLGAVTLACVTLLLWATIGIERGVGNIVEPISVWQFVTDQGLITLLVSLGGWLIVRERTPAAYVVLLLALVSPIVSRLLVESSVTSGAYALVTLGVVVIIGLGGAWAAVAIDRWVRARRTRSETARLSG